MVNGDVWDVSAKKELTPREVLIVAYANLIERIDQHKLAGMYGVNQGRINEAIKVMQWAADNHRQLHKERMARMHGKETE
jgi:hypothetical protein